MYQGHWHYLCYVLDMFWGLHLSVREEKPCGSSGSQMSFMFYVHHPVGSTHDSELILIFIISNKKVSG